MDITVLEDQ